MRKIKLERPEFGDFEEDFVKVISGDIQTPNSMIQRIFNIIAKTAPVNNVAVNLIDNDMPNGLNVAFFNAALNAYSMKQTATAFNGAAAKTNFIELWFNELEKYINDRYFDYEFLRHISSESSTQPMTQNGQPMLHVSL